MSPTPTDAVPGDVGLPSEEEIAAAMLVAFTENGLPAYIQEKLCYGDPGFIPPKLAHAASRAILSLIRPAFDAKDQRIRELAALLDKQMGTPCEQIRHQQEIEALREQAHYANGVAELAMKHRDAAEAKLAGGDDTIPDRIMDIRGRLVELGHDDAAEALGLAYACIRARSASAAARGETP